MAAGTDIFISYKREEWPLAQAYANAFHSKGYVVATDLNVPEGTEFGDAIDTMIREATLVVVLWTPEAADSRWVRSEAIAAYKQDKYLGVLAEPVNEDDLPFEVRHTQYLDVTGHAQTTAIRTVTDSASARIEQLRSAARAQETQQQRLAEDMEFYAKVHAVREPSGYQAYLNLYPRGVFHKEAKAQITGWSATLRRYLGSPGALIHTSFAAIGAIAAVYAIFAPEIVSDDGRTEIARLTAENTRLEDADTRLRKTADTLRTQLAEANKAAAQAGSSEREKLKAAEQQRAKLQSDLDAAEKRATDLSRQLATETSERSDLAAKLSEAQGEAKRLQDELDALAASVTPVARPETATAGTDESSIAERRAKALREFGCENNTGVMVLNRCRPLDTKNLNLYSADITDLTPLAALTELETLYLWNTQVSDVRALQGLRGLQELNLANTQVSDLRALEGMRGLQRLYLTNTQVSDLRGLEGMRGLQGLNLHNTQVTDLSPLTRLKSLGLLYLGGANSLSDLSPLLQLGTVHWIELPDGTDAGDWQRDTPETRAAVQRAIRNWKP